MVGGGYAAGQLLPTEPQLCEKYGVSRTALREAIRSLVAKGLIETRPRTGTRVRPPSTWANLDPDVIKWRLATTDTETYLSKMFHLRMATEPMACELAARHGTADMHKVIRQAFLEMAEAGDDNEMWVKADIAFHKAIYFATSNEFFWPLGEILEFGLVPMFTIAAQGSHRPRAVEEHRRLCDAILARDVAGSRRASLEMLENAASDIDRIRTTGR